MKRTTLLLLASLFSCAFIFGFACSPVQTKPAIIQTNIDEEDLIQEEIANPTVLIIGGGGHGTGVVFKQDKKHAYILTANHVIHGITSLWGRQVIDDKYEFEPLKIIIQDIPRDMAILESEPVWAGVAKIITADTDIVKYRKAFIYGCPGTIAGPLDGILTEGRICRLNDITMDSNGATVASVPVTFGNSGGGLFVKKNGHFVLAGVVKFVGLAYHDSEKLIIFHISGSSTGIQLLNFLDLFNQRE